MEHLDVDDIVIKEVNDSTTNDNENNSDDQMDIGRILGMIPIFILLLIMFVRIIFVIYKSSGQKTRNSQQRRPYTRQQQSVSQAEPTIYVSPANLPPPPKYEAMPPPSYEEVVGIHYPNYQPPVQPITQPITTALAQSSQSADANISSNERQIDSTTSNNVTTVTNVRHNEPVASSTVIIVTNERTTVTASS